VFAFPSLVEGFGLPPLEAMACGTPVVAANNSAVSEAVGDAALTFDPCDPGELATHLTSVLTDTGLRTTLIQRGSERVRSFTWDRVARATLQAYTSVETPHSESTHVPTR
jgi:glycosyltransferase involved in cell wall biosynthesis